MRIQHFALVLLLLGLIGLGVALTAGPESRDEPPSDPPEVRGEPAAPAPPALTGTGQPRKDTGAESGPPRTEVSRSGAGRDDGSSLAVTVFDPYESPLPDARVRLGEQSTVSGPDGTAEVEREPGLLVVSHSRYATAHARVEADTASVAVHLALGASISGQVVLAEDPQIPAPGVRVEARSSGTHFSPPSFATQPQAEVRVAVADEAGQFAIQGLASAQKYVLTTHSATYWSEVSPACTPPAEGLVLPVFRARLYWIRAATEEHSHVPAAFPAWTPVLEDAQSVLDGRQHLHRIVGSAIDPRDFVALVRGPEGFAIEVEVAGYSRRRVAVKPLGFPPRPEVVLLEPKSGETGALIFRLDAPASDKEESMGVGLRNQRTGAYIVLDVPLKPDGNSQSVVVPAGDYLLDGLDTGYVVGARSVTIQVGQTSTVSVARRESGGLTVTVLRGESPLAEARVLLKTSPEGGSKRMLLTDDRGTATFLDLPEAEYVVTVLDASEEEPQTQGPFTVDLRNGERQKLEVRFPQ